MMESAGFEQVADTAAVSPSLASEIQGLMTAEVCAGRTVGVALAVTSSHAIVFAGAAGLADQATDRAVMAQTRFRIGSLTKQFTATSIELLADDGTLSLDDPVARYIDGFATGEQVTIRQALEHRSRLPAEVAIRPDFRVPIALDELCHRIDAMPPRKIVGDFNYNNLNYLLLSAVIERVTDTSYEDFVRRRVAEPCGLTATASPSAADEATSLATGYTGLPGHFRPAPTWNPSWLAGAGGLASNVVDLARWNMLTLSTPSGEIRTALKDSRVDGKRAYVMGWVVDMMGPVPCLWHDGEVSGFRSISLLFPGANLSVVVLCNIDGLVAPFVSSPRDIARAVAAKFAAGITPPRERTPSILGRSIARVRDVFHRRYFASGR